MTRQAEQIGGDLSSQRATCSRDTPGAFVPTTMYCRCSSKERTGTEYNGCTYPHRAQRPIQSTNASTHLVVHVIAAPFGRGPSKVLVVPAAGTPLWPLLAGRCEPRLFPANFQIFLTLLPTQQLTPIVSPRATPYLSDRISYPSCTLRQISQWLRLVSMFVFPSDLVTLLSCRHHYAASSIAHGPKSHN